jgi:NCAIR mutase (PurE)-related protein
MPPSLRTLLEAVRNGQTSIDAALTQLHTLPYENIDCATVDHHRELRKGFPEVIYCAGKTPDHVAAIAETLAARCDRLLGTRATLEQFDAARQKVPALQYHPSARCLYLDNNAPKHQGIAIVAAGTSDLPVADEAAITLQVMGHDPLRITDVGVAGLHRLLARIPDLLDARCVIVVAGMEGALPSVVAGLLPAPVIAVPTSVGYGASFNGLAALLGMLNSCSSGIATVNIDNGFGAAFMAAAINNQCLKMLTPSSEETPPTHRKSKIEK